MSSETPAPNPRTAPVAIIPGTPVITLSSVTSPGSSLISDFTISWTSTNAAGGATLSITPSNNGISYTSIDPRGSSGSGKYRIKQLANSVTYTITVTTTSATGHTAFTTKTVNIPMLTKKGGRKKSKESKNSTRKTRK